MEQENAKQMERNDKKKEVNTGRKIKENKKRFKRKVVGRSMQEIFKSIKKDKFNSS